MHTTVLLLGGNKGDVLSTFQLSIQAFEEKGYTLFKKSSIYCSKSWGYESENIFYNQVLILKTNNSPQDILNDLLSIEEKLGRTRNSSDTYEDRTIDIDIIFYDDRVIEEENLVIPHPRLHLRNFCLVPLMEIIPNFIHPGLNKSIGQLTEECTDSSIISTL